MYTVLICDDQPDIVNALNIYLTPEGYRILTAASGTEALEIAKREEIHLILLDVMMPRMDGITATAKFWPESGASSVGTLSWAATPPPPTA